MNTYLLVKTAHILSATILFGTGLGTAFFFYCAHRRDVPDARLFAARTTVIADFLFTLPAVIVQPATGIWLLMHGPWRWNEPWLYATYLLYFVAGLCWIPVVLLQLRMKRLLEQRAAGGEFDTQAYERLQRVWFVLGWPAFGALIAVFWLMVAKPSW